MVHKQSGELDSVNSKQDKFKKDLDIVLMAIEEELLAHENGKVHTSNLVQLEKIKWELECMRQKLSHILFTPTYPRMIVDSWDYTNKLGNELLDVYETYLKL